MDCSFEGQTVIVTGGGRGLGRAHALEFARRGGTVVVNDNGCDVNGRGSDPAVADAVVAEIQEAGGKAVPSYDDISTYEGGYNVVKTAMDATGRVDAIVCNAGILRDLAFHNMGEEDWDASIAGHLKGCYTVLHAAWPVFRQQAYGRVVITTSISGLFGNFGQANYASAHAGKIGLMNVLKIEGEKYNVMVNVISPGASTRMGATIPPRPDRPQTDRSASLPERVSPAVVYMASSDCTETGIIIHGSGGNFYRVAIMRNEGLKAEPDVEHNVEWFKQHWPEITKLEDPFLMWNVYQSREDHMRERASG